MSHSKIHWLYQTLERWNEAIVPGRGKLVGLNPKYDWITPLDAVPFLGPFNKLNKGRRAIMASSGKLFLLGVGIYGDILIIKQGMKYFVSGNGSGAPIALSPSAPTKAISRSSSARRPCPRGMRWDRKKGKCVRIKRR